MRSSRPRRPPPDPETPSGAGSAASRPTPLSQRRLPMSPGTPPVITSGRDRRPDCAGAARPPRDAPGNPARHAAKRINLHAAARSPQTRQRSCGIRPPDRPQCRRERMAGRREQRRQEHRIGPGPHRTQQADPVMRRAGHQPRRRQPASAPPAVPQMDPCPGRRRPSRVAGHDQHRPARPAHPCDPLHEHGTPRRGIMAEHHAAKPGRQLGDGRQRVRRPRPIGEHPQHRQPLAAPAAAPSQTPRLDLARPCDKPGIHAARHAP